MLIVTAVVAALLSRASGALLLALSKVSPIVCVLPGKFHADVRSGDQSMGDAVSAGAGGHVTMNCKFCMTALSNPT